VGRRTELALDRETVLREAFGLLDEKGLRGLNMRALAARLKVQAPALYWHFSSKDELLGHMSALIYREAREAIPACKDWPSWLLAYGRSVRRRLSSQRDAARICSTAQPLAPTLTITAEAIVAPLSAFGLSQEEGLNAISAVTSLCLGWGSYDEDGSMHRFLEGIMDFDRSFEIALEALVAGLELRLGKQSAS
jgi:TetR/AcrR family transcriptional regulator, tetracycline repressor protein